MKARVSRSAVIGALIAVSAIIIATLLSAYFQFGSISPETILKAQKSNMALWFLDGMPFIFSFWGQYVSTIMAYEASSMVIDQTAELRSQTEALEYKAAYETTHDSLTGLPNRILFMDRLEQALNTAVWEHKKAALFILDIDNFKEINDTLGHYSGDRLLKHTSVRLKNVIRQVDTLARIGGDEFAIILPDIGNRKETNQIAKKILKSFTAPFSIEGLKIEVLATIGAAIAPEHGKDVDSIMQRADVAMYTAKQTSSRFEVYSSLMDKNSPKRLTMMGELRQAIETDQLVLHFQPKFNLKSKTISGAEALIRWQHPQHGFMLPGEFIPMAERTGLINPLSMWTIRRALEETSRWHKKGLKISVALNLSPTTLLDPDLPDTLAGVLALYPMEPDWITFEITEGTIIKDPDLALTILTRLSETGFRISIDDFGTGYSSLAYLKQLPTSEIKIDKSFILDMLKNENDAVIVKSIVDLGHNLSLNVVAEGVENKQTALRLKSLNCDILQGNYFSPPMTADAFLTWMAANPFRKKRSRHEHV